MFIYFSLLIVQLITNELQVKSALYTYLNWNALKSHLKPFKLRIIIEVVIEIN